MPSATPTSCAACGSAVSGKFCSHCGAAAGPRQCDRCQAELSAQARFCHRCGAPAGQMHPPAPGAGAGAVRQTPWIVAAVIIVLALGGILYRVSLGTSPAPSPDMANAGNATPGAGAGVPAGRAPDISRMSPKERFDRLNDRVMQAAEKGDSAFVSNFTPMAVAAYEQLDTVDVDTRYHAALLHLGVGETAPALALADTILSESKNNLFGYLVRATVAEKKGDAAEVARNRTAFATHYAAEIAKPRPEYVDHRVVLDAFARSAPPAAK